jgi:NitT/TauT family transport system substrate-binding protein
MRDRRIVTLLVVLAASSGVACSRQPESAKPLDVVRVAAHGRLSSSVIFIADEEGFFRDEGIRLQFIDSPRSTQALPLLDRGDIDVLGASASVGMFSALGKGARFRIVADRGHLEADGCDYDAIMGNKNVFASDSVQSAEMRGKRFSVNGVGTAAYITDMYLKSIGLSLADIKVEKLNETVEAQALESGALDALHVAEPFLTSLRAEGHRVLARGGTLAPGAHISMMLFGPSILEGRRELGDRFMRAFLRGARQYAEGPTQRNLDIIARRGNYDAAMLKSVCLPKVRTNGELSNEWLAEFQKWAVGKGYLERVISPAQSIDMSFARAASAALANPAKTK